MKITARMTGLLFLLLTAPAFAYEKTVELPDCDVLISKKEDWSLVNSPEYRVFCVTPAVYTHADTGVIHLTRSGSPENKRYLRWYDPDNPADRDTHVVDIPADRQAVIPQFKLHANNWVMDRIVIRGSMGVNALDGNATGNILNRILIENARSTGLYIRDSHENTLQNSVMRNPAVTPGRDSYNIYFHTGEAFHVINNELYNASGISQGPLSGSNHVIYGNEIYISRDWRTDCKGNYDREGKCACGEVGMVLKGVTGQEQHFLIEKNIIYGYLGADTKCSGTGSPGEGINLGSGHNPTENVSIIDNVISDSHFGIFLASHVKNVRIHGNQLINNTYGLSNSQGKNIDVTDNTYAANNKNYLTSKKATARVRNNRVLGSEPDSAPVCITVGKFTNPHSVCLPRDGLF